MNTVKHKTKSLVVAICVPELIAREAKDVSLEFQKLGGLYVLDNITYLPHITLYRGEFPLNVVSKIRSEIEKITSKELSFSLHPTDFRQNSFGYVDIGYKVNKKILTLQRKIVRALNPLRIKRFSYESKNITKKQHQNFLQYGYDYVGSNFIPHLTFTKCHTFNNGFLKNIQHVAH